MLISFSGLDCAGKSTQITLLKEYLQDRGYAVSEVWSRGGYTPGIEAMKNLMRGGHSKAPEEQSAEERQAKVEAEPRGGKLLLWLSILDLVFYWGICFRHKSQGKKVLFCDRYYWDTYIDFSIKYPKVSFDRWLVWKLMTAFYRKPDVSLVLTVTPEESMRRSDLKFEPFPEPKEKRVARLNRYVEEIKNGRWQYEIDCMRQIEPIQKEIRRIVDENL
jgi:thymidylate kinase